MWQLATLNPSVLPVGVKLLAVFGHCLQLLQLQSQYFRTGIRHLMELLGIHIQEECSRDKNVFKDEPKSAASMPIHNIEAGVRLEQILL